MEVRVLGFFGAYPFQHQGTSSYLLTASGYHLLVDAGSQTLTVLEDYLDPLLLDSVVLSHYHYDHIADLGVLQYYRQLHPTPIPTPILPIYGHSEDAVHFEALTMEGVSQGRAYFEDQPLEIGPFTIEFMRTKHPVVCFAMRITENATGKVLIYTADSGYLSTLASFAKGAHCLIADTYLFDGNERHHAHLTAGEAGQLAYEAGVGQLVLSHLPQTGDLALLKQQAEATAGSQIEVVLASQGLLLTI